MAMKSAKRKRNGIPRFYIIYLCTVAAAVIIIIASLGIVSSRLSEFEAVQPKYIAEDIFNKYFSPLDMTALLSDADYDADGASSGDIIEYILSEIGDEPLAYSTGSSQDEDEVKFIVKAGNKKLAAINIRVSDKKTEHGYKTYEFDSLELFLSVSDPSVTTPVVDTFDVLIRVPTGYSVSVDGSELPGTYITGTYLRSDALKYLPSGIDGIPYDIYTLDDMTELPGEVSVSYGGEAAELDFDEEDNIYTANVTYSAALEIEHGELVIEAVTNYAAYMQADKRFSHIKEYFDPDSELYGHVEEAGQSAWMVFSHSGYDFADIEIGEFYDFGDDTFSCHISFTHILHRENSEDRPDYIDMYVFLHKTDSGYKIFEWYNNA